MDCIFCKIIAGTISNYTVAKNKHALAFLDMNPLSKGHTVIIPEVHSETLLDLDDQYIEGLFLLVKQVTKKLHDALNPDGFNIGVNMHKAAGQTVEHLHIHVIPRWLYDGGGSIHSIVNNPPEETLDEVLEQII